MELYLNQGIDRKEAMKLVAKDWESQSGMSTAC